MKFASFLSKALFSSQSCCVSTPWLQYYGYQYSFNVTVKHKLPCLMTHCHNIPLLLLMGSLTCSQISNTLAIPGCCNNSVIFEIFKLSKANFQLYLDVSHNVWAVLVIFQAKWGFGISCSLIHNFIECLNQSSLSSTTDLGCLRNF